MTISFTKQASYSSKALVSQALEKTIVKMPCVPMARRLGMSKSDVRVMAPGLTGVRASCIPLALWPWIIRQCVDLGS